MSTVKCSPLPTPTEQKFVVDTYRDIGEYFAVTRAYLWECVTVAIKALPPNSIVVEVGCGNGKNLKALQDRTDIIAIGCDITPYFVNISQTKTVDTFQATNMALPVRSRTADLVLSIAVLHHFDTENRRRQALDEILRVVRPGGRVLIQVWAKEQPKRSRRTFNTGDNLVGWDNPDKSMYRERFYHVFTEGELESLVCSSSVYSGNFTIINSWYEVGNWVIYLSRNNTE